MKYSKYFGAKRHGFIKIKSVLAPKGAIHLLSENIRYDNYNVIPTQTRQLIIRKYELEQKF